MHRTASSLFERGDVPCSLRTPGFQAIYIYCGKCDLRKGIDGLATLVKEQFHLDPFQKDVLFLFLWMPHRPVQRPGLGRRWVLPAL